MFHSEQKRDFSVQYEVQTRSGTHWDTFPSIVYWLLFLWCGQNRKPTTYLCNAYCILQYLSSVLLVSVVIFSRNGAICFTLILFSWAVEFIHHVHKMCEPTNPFPWARVLNEVNVMIRYNLSDCQIRVTAYANMTNCKLAATISLKNIHMEPKSGWMPCLAVWEFSQNQSMILGC
jgi:hypothetical protein